MAMSRPSAAPKPKQPPSKEPPPLVPLPQVRFPSDSSVDAPPMFDDFVPSPVAKAAQVMQEIGGRGEPLRFGGHLLRSPTAGTASKGLQKQNVPGYPAQEECERRTSRDESEDGSREAEMAVSALLIQQTQRLKGPEESRVPQRGFCMICREDIEDWSQNAYSFCYVHFYCKDCCQAHAKSMLVQNRLPRCAGPKCDSMMDAVSAELLLDRSDFMHYWRLATWAVGALQACPKCRLPLYAWDDEPPAKRSSHARKREPLWNFVVCCYCTYEFCVDCLGPRHAETLTCDQALALREEENKAGQPELMRALASSLADSSTVLRKVDPLSESTCQMLPQQLRTCAGSCLPEQPGAVPTMTLNSEEKKGNVLKQRALSTLRDKRDGDWAECPRCCSKVFKSDPTTCDHITCPLCMYEFCWICLADRDRIEKHGNHYHRTTCKYNFAELWGAMGVGSSELEAEEPPSGAEAIGGGPGALPAPAATSADGTQRTPRNSHLGALGRPPGAPQSHQQTLSQSPTELQLDPDAGSPASLRYFQLLNSNEQRAREDFLRLWDQYVPGGTRTLTVSRPLMREVLLRAARKLGLSPERAAKADDLVASALGPAPPALAVEDAFQIFRSVISELQAGKLDAREVPVRELNTGISMVAMSEAPSMPKGARTVDSAPRKQPIGSSSQSSRARDTTAGSLDTTAQLRPSRAALESLNASLRAALGASQTAYERLVLKAESLQIALARGAGSIPSSGTSSAGAGEFAELHRGLNLKRVHAVSLEAELDRCLDRLRFNSGLRERQRRELATLSEDLAMQSQRAQAAKQQRREVKDKLQQANQESSELSRKAQTEQLRAVMLREAFEQEQMRVGVSLGRAEAFVCDLVAATEGTRRVEVEEQSLARACCSALSELQSAQARDEVEVEARVLQLRRELESLRDETQALPLVSERPDNSSRAAAQNSKLESERHAAATELGEVRRRFQGVAAITNRRIADASSFRQELEVLRARSQRVAAELSASSGSRENSIAWVPAGAALRLEEAAEAGLKAVGTKLSSELAVARSGEVPSAPSAAGVGARVRQAASGHLAERCAARLQLELEEVRSELSSAGAVASSRPRAPSPPEPEAPLVNLEAAALQRKVGQALAAEREHHCRLEEQLLQEQFNRAALLSQLSAPVVLRSGLPPAATPTERIREAQLELQIERRSAELERVSLALQEAQEELRTLPPLEDGSQPLGSALSPVVPAGGGGSESAAAAVAAADLLAAPAVAAAKFQARLAALRGEVTSPAPAESAAAQMLGQPREEEEDHLGRDLRQLQRHLQSLRDELGGAEAGQQKPGAEPSSTGASRLSSFGMAGSARLGAGGAAFQATKMAPAA